MRSQNEDACCCDLDRSIFVVSDGLGGRQAGAVASQIVVSALGPMLGERLARQQRLCNAEVRQTVQSAIWELSRIVQQESSGRVALEGLGATVVLALFRRGYAHIAHLGDSRGYLFRCGQLTGLTEDHSLVSILLRRGEITAGAASTHPARGQLSRHVGMLGEGQPDVRTIALRQRDRLLLCTDGLTGLVADERIASILDTQSDPDEACRHLVDAALEAGGNDNITVLVLDWKRNPPPTGKPKGSGGAA